MSDWMRKSMLSFTAAVLVALPLAAQSWTSLTPPISPSARYVYSMAYDSARQRVILFGGWGTTQLADTWEWDGVVWTQLNPATTPPIRQGHAMAFDPSRGRLVVFGGSIGSGVLDDTWEWDGNDWTLRTPTTSPPKLAFAGMAYHAPSQRIVLFGGGDAGHTQTSSDTWEWDGNDWTKKNPTTSPPARANHGMVYHAALGRTVVFGGGTTWSQPLGDTWEWDGNDWTRKNPATSPSARQYMAMAYDQDRQSSVIFGGGLSWGVGGDETWDYDGNTWTMRVSANKPSIRFGTRIAYDTFNRSMILFGGALSRLLYADTWRYDSPIRITGNGSGRPGQSFTFTLNAKGDEGLAYQTASSLGSGPVPIGSRQIHLSVDNLLLTTVGNGLPTVFANYAGVISAAGQAQSVINMPNLPALVGNAIHTAFVTLSPPAPSGIKSISNTLSFTISP